MATKTAVKAPQSDVKNNPADAIASANKRVQSYTDQCRKIGNMRTWNLTDAQKKTIAEHMVRKTNDAIGRLMGTGSNKEAPFEL